MSKENEVFIAKLMEGDKYAYECLFNSYYAKLTFFANRFVNDIGIAEEITGEVFVILWEKRQHLNISSSISSYLYSMTKNRCINYLKHLKIESLYLNYLQKNNLLDSYAIDVERCYDDKELARQIQYALDSLPERCRQVFVMSRYEDMKYRDIATKLEISPKTVERHMGIALERLRKILKDTAPWLKHSDK